MLCQIKDTRDDNIIAKCLFILMENGTVVKILSDDMLLSWNGMRFFLRV